jgi:tetratricopeptide (TPR) repeat protein
MRGLGDAHLQITTSSPQAQAYFDQGLRMLHGFNHGEAARAFRYAQQLDPNCAMCFWGEAFALGPNINAPMDPHNNDAAYRAAYAAFDKSANVTPPERALIEAMSIRYTRTWPTDRAPFDGGFAQAMSSAADQFPQNDLIQILDAEADMDTQPWDYWDATGRNPKGRAGEAIQRIETVLARSPRNAGAIHLYIHLSEASTNPWRAEDAAEKLAALAPEAGHLVHMPAHIYYRVGRFREAMQQNVIAADVDARYIATAHASPVYQYGYYTHNLHFVITSAQQGGDGRIALDYADRLDHALPNEMAAQFGMAQPVKAAPWFARAQFAAPQTVLASTAPPNTIPYTLEAWHYARAIAFIKLGRLSDARHEADVMQALAQSADFSPMASVGMPVQDILSTLRHVVLGKAFMAEHKYDEAITELSAAADIQAHIAYTEPPYIYYPVRRTLGAAYLLAHRPGLAEQEFLQTLIESPNDAYAYWGLAEAKRMMGDTRGASAAHALFTEAYLGTASSLTAMSL